MTFFGLGKPRSKLGKTLDKYRISQEEISKETGISNSTISRLCKGDAFTTSAKNAAKIIKALNKKGINANYEDFWSL